jgi:hypothetical protein
MGALDWDKDLLVIVASWEPARRTDKLIEIIKGIRCGHYPNGRALAETRTLIVGIRSCENLNVQALALAQALMLQQLWLFSATVIVVSWIEAYYQPITHYVDSDVANDIVYGIALALTCIAIPVVSGWVGGASG